MAQLQEMLQLWMALCLMWQGAHSFMVHNAVESLCLEDSLRDAGVQLRRCSLDSELQQWLWTERWFLLNVGTHRCLSGLQDDPIQTVECDGGDHLQWQCTNHRLISVNRSLELSAQTGRLSLTSRGINTRWKSLDEGDICQEKLRSRRQSEPGEFEFSEEDRAHMPHTMTEEQREFLKWFYRTEDSTLWVFSMLVLSFLALLLGCVLLVMGVMGNRNRRNIAKYKASASAVSTPMKVEMEELQIITHTKDENHSYTAPMQDSHLENNESTGGANETEALKPGEIIVSWKDGNVSNLYPESLEDRVDENVQQ
ncbi:solute carrier family 51 subunit beta [Astyanax mexicanus]|uniref:solute carrier family 51 subunit beta n=1 Tax=Astyanax mexicanus TaxID=7994 RepID=UPI0020CAB866|nr:solute carrier family 51 subunit beta [Astyanax mexicanus]